MILINSSLCSSEFNAAFSALKKGNGVRRKCWPDGQLLKMQPSGFIGVVRHGINFAPPWAGPSNEESDATDWEIVVVIECGNPETLRSKPLPKPRLDAIKFIMGEDGFL